MENNFLIINEKKEVLKNLEVKLSEVQEELYELCNLKMSPLYEDIYQLQGTLNDLKLKKQQLDQTPRYYKKMLMEQLIFFLGTLPLAYIIPLLNNIIEFGVYNVTPGRFLQFFSGFVVFNGIFYYAITNDKREEMKKNKKECLNFDKYKSDLDNKADELLSLRREHKNLFEKMNIINKEIEQLKYDILCLEKCNEQSKEEIEKPKILRLNIDNKQGKC